MIPILCSINRLDYFLICIHKRKRISKANEFTHVSSLLLHLVHDDRRRNDRRMVNVKHENDEIYANKIQKLNPVVAVAVITAVVARNFRITLLLINCNKQQNCQQEVHWWVEHCLLQTRELSWFALMLIHNIKKWRNDLLCLRPLKTLRNVYYLSINVSMSLWKALIDARKENEMNLSEIK